MEIDLSTAHNSELADAFIEGRKLQSETALFDQFGILTEDYFLKKVQSILGKYIEDKETLFKVFQKLTNPWSLSTPQKELIDIYKCILKLSKIEKLDSIVNQKDYKKLRIMIIQNVIEDVKKMSFEYGWLPVFLKNSSWGEDHYIREISNTIMDSLSLDLNPDAIKQKIDELSDINNKNKKVVESLYEKYNFKQSETIIIDIFRLVMDTRNESEYLIGYASLVLLPIIQEIQNRLQISDTTFGVLYFDEIVNLLNKNELISNIPIDDRLDVCGYWFIDDHKFTLIDKEIATTFLNKQKSLIESIVENSSKNNEDIVGICASVGKVEGIVKIINGIEDFEKFKTDDILVAESTTADYVPLMRKAGGIIAEHGGVTCHAAIVSRELGIPAIVGYPLATKVFHDGQRVYFDAITGIVKIISEG